MKTIVARRAGTAEVLQEEEVPRPEPRAGEALIQVRAVGVNFADILQRRGTYAVPTSFPFTPGMEVAGLVASSGAGGPMVGARVAALLPAGGYSEYVVAPSSALISIPETVSFETAVALLIQGLTAYSLVEAAGQVSGKTAFVSAAAGGVGRLLIQRLGRAGAVVVAGVGDGDKERDVVARAAAMVTRYDQPGWVDRLPTLDLLFDATGGDVYRGAMSRLGRRGTAFIYGASGGDLVGAPADIAGRMIALNQRLVGHALPAFLEADASWAPRTLGQLFEHATSGALEVLVQTFPLRAAASAHRALEERLTRGKIVLLANEGAP